MYCITVYCIVLYYNIVEKKKKKLFVHNRWPPTSSVRVFTIFNFKYVVFLYICMPHMSDKFLLIYFGRLTKIKSSDCHNLSNRPNILPAKNFWLYRKSKHIVYVHKYVRMCQDNGIIHV